MKRKIYFLSLVMAMVVVAGLATGCTKKIADDTDANTQTNDSVNTNSSEINVNQSENIDATTSDITIDIDKEVNDLDAMTSQANPDDLNESGLSDIK